MEVINTYIQDIYKKYFKSSEKMILFKNIGGDLSNLYKNSVHVTSLNKLNELNKINEFYEINKLLENNITQKKYIVKCVIDYFKNRFLPISEETLIIISRTLCLRLINNYDKNLINKIENIL